jgi:hypothetical protein
VIVSTAEAGVLSDRLPRRNGVKNAIALLALITSTLVYSPRAGADFLSNGPSAKGQEVTTYLPETQHMRNRSGMGLGLCVFTSIELAARYQNVVELDGYQEWMTKRMGGGYPEKVDSTLAKFCNEKGVQVPAYVQHTGGDEKFLELALATGRMPSVTYDGRDGVYYRGRVAHMVDLAHLSESTAAIQDNNYPGKWLWMSRAEFLERWRGNGGGWAVVLLGPPPAPIPVNAK